MDAQTAADLASRFTHHQPNHENLENFNEIRRLQHEFAMRIVEIVPAGREMALALTNLEQVGFWANAGISRKS